MEEFFLGSQLSLFLSLGSIIEIKNNGTFDDRRCSHNIDIYIGNTIYAIFRGTGRSTQVDFAALIAAGGTFNAVITTPLDNPTYSCVPSSFQDFEDYFIMYSIALEICKFARHNRIKICNEEFAKGLSKGFCASQNDRFYGHKLHGVCSLLKVFHMLNIT